ncbi:hypothetical protein TW81_03805 [Vibrio galatheae]|uniref:Diguanylate phosphodiesterase n=1 Tax=Vibrio galatheae TaxID=579748 RepID=A0A0F4NP87_9VIBR|nr:EAL domain-containing response regulator [Vibrio galatheae]KJY84663.1 hypothetical protein TW81_03805 [Vibrio galatheae]
MNKNINVMLIDDHPLHLRMLECTLRELGVTEVHSFTSVNEATQALDKNQYHLILCDLSMPEHDGIDMLELLNEKDFNGNVAIISGLDQPVLSTVREMCRGFSFNLIAQINKPFVVDEINSLFTPQQVKSHKTAAPAFKVNDAAFLYALADGQICNYYQPQICIKTGEVIGVEALVRWLHPSHGVLFPNSFLPIVQSCQLSNELFETVLENALSDMQKGLLPYKVSVNADQANLENPDFADQVMKMCRQYSIDPNRLTIEITEEYSYRKSRSLYKNLAKLRVNHINVSIDDFGTGYSSLENLYAFPFNEIKIDRSFVYGIEDDEKKQRIVTLICNLARDFSINVVAEGIETEASKDILHQLNVNVLQGYLISKPIPVSEMKTFLGQ